MATMIRTVALSLLAVAGCSSSGTTPTGDGGVGDGCPTWPDGTVPASGTLVAMGEGGTPPRAADIRIGVEAVVVAPGEELVTVRACTVKLYDEYPWEPWAFAATWRLAGPINQSTPIPAATLTGTPGMSGGFSVRELDCSMPNDCQPEVTDDWMFFRSGAGEIVVTQYALRALASSGWVQTDAPITPEYPPARRVDLELDITW